MINPVAGVGGPAAMKGSDDPIAQATARSLNIEPQAEKRCAQVLDGLLELGSDDAIRIFTGAGDQGGALLERYPFESRVLPLEQPQGTGADTQALVVKLLATNAIDLLLFVGGDGTARDLLDGMRAASAMVPVVGVPAGVKMHSGVFATSPKRAAELIALIAEGGLVSGQPCLVRDIDEEALRAGEIRARDYGELLVPEAAGYLQHLKSSGKEVEELVLLDIAAEVQTVFADYPGTLAIGPGSTCMAVKEAYGIAQPTLLGFDLVHAPSTARGPGSIELDVDAVAIESALPDLKVVLSFSRRQGFLLGRGNQQLSAAVVRALLPDGLCILGTRTKLASLEGRPLLVDSGSAELDTQLSGMHEVVSGFDDHLLYRVEHA